MTMMLLTNQLADMLTRGDELQQTIREYLKGIGYEF